MRHAATFLLAFAVAAFGLAFGTAAPMPLLIAAGIAAVTTVWLAATPPGG